MRSVFTSRGVTLIMVAAVLAILAALGTGFYTMMLMATKSATRYSDSVRAEMMAKAGVEFAIAGLRQQAYKKTEDPTDPWFMVDYLHGASKRISFPDNAILHNGVDDDKDGVVDNLDEININPAGNLSYTRALGNTAGTASDRFSLNVSDAASKININACDNLAVVLDNLCRVIGPPLVAADLDAIQPRRWATELLAGNADPIYTQYATANNTDDISTNQDVYYWLYDEGGNRLTTGQGRPKRFADGTAVYGDGYAIAGWRGMHGPFQSITDVKDALTYVERSAPPDGIPNDPLERLEVEVKFQAIQDYITIESWVDTNTVCVGKFEWVTSDTGGGSGGAPAYSIAIDRDKSWVLPALNDAKNFKSNPNGFVNQRGSLIGCYLSIMNGHGSGQLRIIVDNGIDWIRVEPGFVVEPGPISSYMIVARDPASFVDAYGSKINALPDPITMDTHVFPETDAIGNLVANINVDYVLHPLCIHRAPVNINTASDKVLEALFMGLNVQHGHPMSVGTDVDLAKTSTAWKTIVDPDRMEPFVLTPAGLKRTPVSSGKPILDRPVPWNSPASDPQFGYLNNFNSMGAPNYTVTTGFTCNEAHELAYRVIQARTKTLGLVPGTPDPDSLTADPGDGPAPYNMAFPGFNKGPFRSWDDLYFRVVKPWDDIRSGYLMTGKSTIPNSGNPGLTAGLGKASVGRLIMANFNSNTDILKFNPNIEWIDRWGRNFTDEEGVMAFTNDPPDMGVKWSNPNVANPLLATSQPIFTQASVTNQNRGTQVLAQDWLNQTDDNSGSYIIRSYRYRSDEMIDKTDLNRSTTEFAFESRGIYDIQSTGQVISKDGTVQSERKIEALVKIYDVWRETTQRQFVQGTITPGPALVQNWANTRSDIAGMGPRGSSHSGTIARDSVNTTSRLPLTTQPEPLVPLQYRIDNTKTDFGGAGQGLPNTELVDPGKVIRDQYGDPKTDPTIPDVVANKIIPASYDGQIVLATNTSSFDPSPNGDADTFLASFNGDLDTDTCLGNGREQAKMPHVETPAKFQNQGYKFRVVDTCSLLGILNDPLIDVDTDLPANPNGFTWPAYDSNWGGWTPLPSAQGPPAVYHFPILSKCLGGLNPNNYWENVSMRMGDLRTDGVYLGGPGVCGNEATIKYLFGDGKTACNDSWIPGNAKLNFNPGSADGNIVSLWFKSTWHHNDKRTHPLFDAANPGAFQGGTACRACYLKKFGALVWALNWGSDSYVSGNRSRTDDLYFSLEGNIGLGQNDGDRDKDLLVQLHGGFNWVKQKFAYGPKKPNDPQPYAPWNGNSPEAPSFRVQPFRWQFAGMRWRFNSVGAWGSGGHWRSGDDGQNAVNTSLIGTVARPFIDSQTNPELVNNGSGNKLFNSYWSSIPNANMNNHQTGFTEPCDIGDTGLVNCNGSSTTPGSGFGASGQPVKWVWADPSGQENPLAKIFGANNLNQDVYTWIYQHLPADGTYAVIDELKISSRERLMNSSPNPYLAQGAPSSFPNTNTADWSADNNNPTGEILAHDRGLREQTLSRYYLPPNPSDPGNCPVFTSQSMLQSLKGFTTTAATPEYITVARVTWSVFTPRFLHQYKTPQFNRTEHVTRDLNNQTTEVNPFRGPFDYDKYNEIYSATTLSGQSAAVLFPYGVDRPTPRDYQANAAAGMPQQSHYTQGVEVELLNKSANGPIPGSMESPPGSGQFVDVPTGTFTDPDVINRFMDASGNPVSQALVSTSDLQYRVRFRYPVDQLVDPNGGKAGQNSSIPMVDPVASYMLDTPVFDDISITYFIKPRILYYREATE